MEQKRYRQDFIHHQASKISDSIREVVFGAEDGMVSTLGALTGIAIGTANSFTVILAGLVILAVESTGMSIGSFLSNKSVKEVDRRKLAEEAEEIQSFPEQEAKELITLYIKDGWPENLAQQMAAVAKTKPPLMLKEMAYRELAIAPDSNNHLVANSVFMFFSYVVGGAIPILPYLFLPIPAALPLSILITLIGLFGLGALTTRFTKRNWLKAGLEMLVLASIAASIGYFIGRAADMLK